MNDYRSTINLPGQPRGQVGSWPDSPRTAVLVGQGILVPVERAWTEPIAADVPSGPSEADLTVEVEVELAEPPSGP